MHIFIDESGSFAPTTKPSSVSAVGALVIPSHQMAGFKKLYTRLRRTLPKQNGEVKGRLLSEAQVGQVVEVVRKVGGIFEVLLVDMALHSKESLEEHRARQAQGVTVNLTDEHDPDFRAGLWEMRRQLETMPLQLYVQAQAMEMLVYHTVHHLLNYQAFHCPADLRSFHWVIDAKHDGHQPTPWEDWWHKTVMPLLEAHTKKRPFLLVEEGNYNALDRFETTLGDWKRRLVETGEREVFFDVRLLMEEDFRFSSEPEPGLEVVDVLVNAMRRSVSGNFRREGWLDLPKLMIHRKPQCFHFVMLGKGEPPELSLPYASVLQDFRDGGRFMLPRRMS